MFRWKTCQFGSGAPAARWVAVLAMVMTSAGSALAQQAADACADAPTVGEGTFQTPFGIANNEGFTAPCDPVGSDGSPDLWLDYVPAANGTAIFNTCGLTSADTSIAVLDGCPESGGNVLACNDDFSAFCSSVSLAVTAGHHYKVRIAKVSFGLPGLNPRMSIDFIPICTALPGAPANDCCAAATMVTPSTVSVNTTGATRDFAGECGLGSPFPDVWYSFTPATSGNFRIKQDAAADPLEFVVLTGGCAAPTVVVCHAGILTNIEQVVFAATAGTPYLIRVTGLTQPELVSSFVLESVSPPTNDDCDTAQPINGYGTFTYDSTLANNTGPDDGNQCSSFGTGDIAHDVWFLWTGSVPAGEDVEVSTCAGSPLDTRLSVYVGGCNGTQPLNPVVACNDDYCLGLHQIEGVAARLVFRPVAGVPYLIRIGSFPNPLFDVGGYPGTFTISHIPECHIPMPTGATVEPEPCGQDTNGGCFSRDLAFTSLPCGTTTIYGTALPGNDDWYQFSTPVNTNVTVAFQSEFAGEADLLESVCPPGPFAINLLRRNDGCAEFATPDFTQPIDAGTYYVAVVNLDPFATCDYHSHYVLTVSVERCAPIGRCCAAGACSVVTQAECAAAGGVYSGDNTTCPSPGGHYDAALTAGAIEDISATGTLLDACGDNCGQSDVPIGFSFNYFGLPHTTVDISTNGFMTFDADFFLGSPYNSAVPGFLPHQLICALWQDYNTDPTAGGAGNVYYQTLGTAPNRRFVVMWKGLATETALEIMSTFEAVLFESSNSIQFRYGFIDLANGPTVGISDQSGTIGDAIDIGTLGAGVTLTHVVDPNPCGCAGDFNHSGAVSVQDIFDFLSAYFTNSPDADFNHSGAVSVQDIFDFLTAYFTPCP